MQRRDFLKFLGAAAVGAGAVAAGAKIIDPLDAPPPASASVLAGESITINGQTWTFGFWNNGPRTIRIGRNARDTARNIQDKLRQFGLHVKASPNGVITLQC